MSEFEYVEFTGDERPVRDLDDHESLGTWAGHCWRALLALDDYAELSASRTFRAASQRIWPTSPQAAMHFRSTGTRPSRAPTWETIRSIVYHARCQCQPRWTIAVVSTWRPISRLPSQPRSRRVCTTSMTPRERARCLSDTSEGTYHRR